jgi:hypothetical protein
MIAADEKLGQQRGVLQGLKSHGRRNYSQLHHMSLVMIVQGAPMLAYSGRGLIPLIDGRSLRKPKTPLF